MAEAGAEQRLSTSALAKALDLPLNQLFATLRDYGWIRKVDDGWILTGKGEFEGGAYVHSKRFGRYIVWPQRILQHPLITGLENNRRLAPAQLARRYHTSVRELQRIFGEQGLLCASAGGWLLTERGETAGGIEFDSDHNGQPYVLWPESVLEDPQLAAALEYARALSQGGAGRDDLFAEAEFDAPDGHCFRSRGELMICHWLYLAGIAHACGRPLPEGDHRADFFLPRHQLYIDYLGDERDGHELSVTLARLEIYRTHQWPLVEVRPEHLDRLDVYLTRMLGRHGVEVL